MRTLKARIVQMGSKRDRAYLPFESSSSFWEAATHHATEVGVLLAIPIAFSLSCMRLLQCIYSVLYQCATLIMQTSCLDANLMHQDAGGLDRPLIICVTLLHFCRIVSSSEEIYTEVVSSRLDLFS